MDEKRKAKEVDGMFERWGYTWEGAFSDPLKLQDRSGVYVIWCKNKDQWNVLDVGESANVQTRVTNHDRSDCWSEQCSGKIFYSAHYTPNAQHSGRRDIEQKLRSLLNTPCGDR